MRTILTADRLHMPEDRHDLPALIAQAVAIEDGIIAQISNRADVQTRPDDQVFDFPGCTILPAFFDVHIHGAAGHDVMEATPESFASVSQYLATRGVCAFLSTTVTAAMDTTLASLSRMAKLIGVSQFSGALPVGIHLEGPFLSHAKRGVHPPHQLQEPSIEKFDRFWQAAEGHIKLITIAPELPNAVETIAYAASLGVRASLGHSDASALQARAGIAAGAVSATHTFNAMRALGHREPGIAGVVLDDEGLYAEIICDGLHVAPEMVHLFWKAKGRARAILVTDAMSATGMPDGNYKLGGLEVEVKGGVCRYEGALAGSTLTLDRAVANFRAFTGASLAEAAALASGNPARMAGLDSSLGSIAVGRSADIVVLDEDGSVRATWVRGRPVFST